FDRLLGVLVLDAVQRAHAGAFGCGLACCLLRAALAFDYAFFLRTNAAVAWHANHIRDDRKRAKLCANLVENQPDFGASYDCGRLRTTAWRVNRSSLGEVDSAASDQWAEGSHRESLALFGLAGVQIGFQACEHAGAGNDCVSLGRQACVACSVG